MMGTTKKHSLPSSTPLQAGRWPYETEEQTRISHHAQPDEAERTSREIDRYLQEGKTMMERRRKGVRILLLGQSESGKSSFLKNFQLTFAPQHFESERSVWRVIIQLNIIGSIKAILEALKEEYEPDNTHPTNPSRHSPLYDLRRIQLTFSPLFFIESNLLKLLSVNCSDSRDISVRAGNGWKMLMHQTSNSGSDDEGGPERSTSHSDDPTSVLSAQGDDIIAMWTDPDVQAILKKRRPRFELSPGFFMNDIARITVPDYVPTDCQPPFTPCGTMPPLLNGQAKVILLGREYARLGWTNTSLLLKKDLIRTGLSSSLMWGVQEISVRRGRHILMMAILFLAPLAFNQVLNEDPRVNRLEDSYHLWRDICTNKLLANANLILFFNKRDVLEATLASGVSVKKFVPAYGDLANDVPTVTKYFREKFRLGHKKTTDKRPFICHETSAIDIKSMAVLLVGVRESILRQCLRDGDLM